MNQLEEKFNKEVIFGLRKDFNYKNVMEVPRIKKISINAGLSRAIRGEQNFIENAKKDLSMITGRQPAITKAKKAISGFKIRKGQNVGAVVTLRGRLMWDFLEKMINAAIPRIKDFQGVNSRNFDDKGNLALGFKEQIIFLEIFPDEINTIFGLQVNITTTAKNKEEGIKLFKLLGLPVVEEIKRSKK